MIIDEHEMNVIIDVFSELLKKPYAEINTYLGSITIEQMNVLYNRMITVKSLLDDDNLIEAYEEMEV